MTGDPTGDTRDRSFVESRALSGSLIGPSAPEWTELLRASPHDFYHLPGYVSVSAAHLDGTACALRVTDGARTILLPLVIRPIEGGGSDATSPYGYPGPIGPGTDDPEFLTAAMGCGVQTLRLAGIVSLFVRLHPLLNQVLPTDTGTVVRHGETVSIDLTLPLEVLWAQMRHNHRRDIRRAHSLGYTTRMDAGMRRFDEFKRLYRATMRRLSAAPFYHFDDTYFDDLRAALGGSVELCVVERGEALAGAALFVETKGIVEYHLAGSTDDAASAHATKLMIHHATGWAKERGDHSLHLGGGVGAADDSLLRFKLGFSPRVHEFSTLRVVVDEDAYARLVRRAGARPSADASGYFPAYRAADHLANVDPGES
jgi:hypothetical protein